MLSPANIRHPSGMQTLIGIYKINSINDSEEPLICGAKAIFHSLALWRLGVFALMDAGLRFRVAC
jgi:hypothetical protein